LEPIAKNIDLFWPLIMNNNNLLNNHWLTICCVQIDANDSENSPIVNSKFQLLMEEFLRLLARDDLKDWSLNALIPQVNKGNIQTLHTLDNLGIPYDTLELSNNYSDKESSLARKKILFPAANSNNERLEERLEQSVFDFSISFCDVVLLINQSDDKSRGNNKHNRFIKDSLFLGKPILEVNSKGSISLLTSSMIQNLDLALLRNGLIDKDLITEYGQKVSIENITLAILNGIKDSFRKHSDIDRVPTNTKFVKYAGRLDAVISTLFSGFKWSDLVKAIKKNPPNVYYGVAINDLPEAHKNEHPISELNNLKKEFSRFDIAANYFSGLYRDANWILYFFSAFAVFAAVSGAISLGGEFNVWLWALAESLSIAGIIALVLISKKQKFHRRWLFSRFYAETIRYARVGLPFLIIPYCLKNLHYGLDKFLSHEESTSSKTYTKSHDVHVIDEDELTSVNGHLKLNLIARLLIDAGLPQSLTKRPYNPADHFHELAKYAQLILSDQINFHRKTFHRNEKIAHNLHKISFYCFILTVFGIAGHFIVHSDLWLIFTAALPALAGAIHGLVTQNEYERVAQISCSAYTRLSETLDMVKNKSSWINLSDTERFLKLQLLMDDAIEVMSGSAQSWQEIIQGRDTSLPA
jgi:hypothetical protein